MRRMKLDGSAAESQSLQLRVSDRLGLRVEEAEAT
jgi:hypothetical protein